MPTYIAELTLEADEIIETIPGKEWGYLIERKDLQESFFQEIRLRQGEIFKVIRQYR